MDGLSSIKGVGHAATGKQFEDDVLAFLREGMGSGRE